MHAGPGEHATEERSSVPELLTLGLGMTAQELDGAGAGGGEVVAGEVVAGELVAVGVVAVVDAARAADAGGSPQDSDAIATGMHAITGQ